MAKRRYADFGGSWTIFQGEGQRRDEPPHIGIFSYGPEHLGGAAEPHLEGGPGAFTQAHPELFATASTTGPEGWFYWGCLQELERSEWQYQREISPTGNKLGSAKVDFLFFQAPRNLAVRIKTPWHIGFFGDPDVVADDALSALLLEDAGYSVIDVPMELYMDDESGLAVKRTVRRAWEQDPMMMPGSMLYYEGV